MKKTIYFLLLQFVVTIAYAQNDISKKKFLLSGMISGLDSGRIVLAYQDAARKKVSDTMTVTNGRFSTSGTISVPTQAFLFGKLSTRSMEDPNIGIVFLEPGNLQLKLENGNFYDAVMTGSLSQKDYQELNAKQKVNRKVYSELTGKMISLRKDLVKRGENPSENSELKLLSGNSEVVVNSIRKQDLSFVRSHPSSAVSLMLLTGLINTKEITLDSARIILDQMPEQFKYGKLGQDAENAIGQKKEELELRAKKTIGTPLPSFIAKDVNGENFNLKTYKSQKYLLIDFWASWCLPCEEQAPLLVQLYKKYSGKNLVFTGISVDRYRAQWLKAPQNNGTAIWKHVLAEDESKATNIESLSQRFAITGYPTLILADPAGKIIYKHSGFNGKESLAELEELLKQVTSN